ncbi:DUF1987 domain-containing protein [Natronospora cellulosivora (SeqCode)]
MEKVFIKASKSTPEVNFDPEESRLVIKGESYPENSIKFYKPLIESLKQFSDQISTKFIVDIKLTYLNTSSIKTIINILDIIDNAYQHGKDIEINWYYESDNEILYETAAEFNSFFDVKINLISE